MKKLNSIFTVFAVLTAMLFAMAAGVQAEDKKAALDINKPVAIISLAGYDAFFGDLRAVGELADNTAIGSSLELPLQIFFGGILRDLDKTLPAGCLVMYDGKDVGAVIFVPYKDLDTLLEFAQQQGMDAEAEAREDGMTVLSLGGEPVYIKRGGKYLYFSTIESLVKDVPEDGAKLLAGMDEKYTLGVRAIADNLNPEVVKTLFAALDEGMNAAFETQLQNLDEELEEMDDENEEEMKNLRDMMQASIENNRKTLEYLKSILGDFSALEIGYAYDKQTDELKMHCVLEVKEGSDLSKSIAKNKDLKSRFSGFDKLDVIATGYSISYQDEKAREYGKSALENAGKIIAQARKMVAKENKAAEIYFGLLEKSFPELATLVDAEYTDSGMAFDMKPGSVTCVATGTVTDPKPLDKLINDLIEKLVDDGWVRKEWVKKDVAQWEGFTFQQVTMTVRDLADLLGNAVEEDAMQKVETLFGETLVFTYGSSKDAYVAGFGEDVIETFKKGAKPVDGMPVLKFRLSAVKTLECIKQFTESVVTRRDREDATFKQSMYIFNLVITALKELPGQDNLTVVAVCESDTKVHAIYTMEKGVVRLLGSLPNIATLAQMYDPDDDDWDDEDANNDEE